MIRVKLENPILRSTYNHEPVIPFNFLPTILIVSLSSTHRTLWCEATNDRLDQACATPPCSLNNNNNNVFQLTLTFPFSFYSSRVHPIFPIPSYIYNESIYLIYDPSICQTANNKPGYSNSSTRFNNKTSNSLVLHVFPFPKHFDVVLSRRLHFNCTACQSS